MSPGIAVAVVPEEFYRKPKGVQFRKSFQKREEAIEYAEGNCCRVVIACEAGSRYDVLYDPASIPGSTISFELVVDRDEMVAVPRMRPSSGKSPELHEAILSTSREPSLKLAWNSVYGWLSA
jgi:hypothetical protein